MKNFKRTLTTLLAAILVFSLLPCTALISAAEAAYSILLQPEFEINGINGTVKSIAGNIAIVRCYNYNNYSTVYHLAQYNGEQFEIIPDIQYHWIYDFTDSGYAVVSDENYRYGVIDKNGNVIIPCQYDNIYIPGSDDKALAYTRGYDDSTSTYYNTYYLLDLRTGETTVLPDKEDTPFLSVSPSDGYFLAYSQFQVDEYSSTYGYKFLKEDLSGYLNDKVYTDATDFSFGYAAVKTVGRYVYQYEIIDAQGTTVGTFENLFPSYDSFSAEGLLAVRDPFESLWGYINTNGETVIPLTYRMANTFSNGYAVVSNSVHEVGLIDTTGEVIIPFGEYEELTNVTETGLVLARDANSNWYLLQVEPRPSTTPDNPDNPNYKIGDITGDNIVDISDALHLFQHSLMPDLYPITTYPAEVDFNHDGSINISDALRLFQYSLMPDVYPL